MNATRNDIANDWLQVLHGINVRTSTQIESSVRDFLRVVEARRGPAPPRLTADEAVEQIRSGDSVFVGAGLCTPPDLTTTLATRGEQLNRVRLQLLGLSSDNALFRPEYLENFRFTSYFIDSPTLRARIADGQADYVPVRLSELFALSQQKPSDVCVIRTSPPDADGLISLSSSTGLNMGKLLSARRVYAELDPGLVPMPGFTRIPLSAVDGYVESSQTFLPQRVERSSRPPSALYEAIAAHAARQIEDDSTVQLGVGHFHPYLLERLREKRGLGLHASFITPDCLELIADGCFDSPQKGIFSGVSIVGSSALTQNLIDFNAARGSVHFYPAEFFSHPSLLGHYRRFVSITGALEVDLTGQSGADSVGTRIYSGLGAQQDFMWGAQISPYGQSIIVLPSMLKDGTQSKICLVKQSGSGQTSSRGDVDIVVTEHGAASLKGLSIAERALALIQLADPRFRASLHQGFFFLGHSDTFHDAAQQS